jgi:hypothetical protein
MSNFQRQIDIMEVFKRNMMEFIDELVEQYPKEGDLIVIRFFLSEQTPTETLIQQFISRVLPHRERIEKRNEIFFIENDNIFGASPKDKVLHFKKLYITMNNDDRKTLWSWFDSFVSLADKYVATCK